MYSDSNEKRPGMMRCLVGMKVQRSSLFWANIVKKDPDRARQNSLATAGTNFTKPGAQNKEDIREYLSGR